MDKKFKFQFYLIILTLVEVEFSFIKVIKISENYCESILTRTFVGQFSSGHHSKFK